MLHMPTRCAGNDVQQRRIANTLANSSGAYVHLTVEELKYNDPNAANVLASHGQGSHRGT